MTNQRHSITVQTIVNASPEQVWKVWTTPEDIMQWNSASDDWHTPSMENDLRVGGQFRARMEAKDGSFGFDFGGTYDIVDTYKRIAYAMEDGRKVDVLFEQDGDQTHVTETFDAEDENSLDMQRFGWQSILDNFKKYTEQGKVD